MSINLSDSVDGRRKREADRWLSQSGHDLESARFILQSGMYALACFLSHQTAEKAVSAYLYARGAELLWGHGLADLCEDAMAFEPSFDLIKSSAVQLDKHYLGARYPSVLPAGVPFESYSSEDGERALVIAEDTYDFVVEQLRLYRGDK
jgi:HEPN domain-containing protein